ncbi:hypothetical protein VTK73DRAFT_3348 [Phialemonium thermophilum]|uniref:Uncharacterized protein n=1 Tax=Phialemonium thermophilum TaxID=223376 RepID=A0ABR3X0Q0_9PEZI
MLDENLPTFRYKTLSDNPFSSVLYFTQNGSDPEPEYILKRGDPAQNPACRNKYAIALCSSFSPSVIYGEIIVEPEWTQPTLSAAELRASSSAHHGGAAQPSPVPVAPDAIHIQLYNPDQTVTLRLVPGSWNKSDSWEFEMPTQTFKVPSASQLDREQQAALPSSVELLPRVTFRWKKDGKLTKDMTCYMTGKSVGGKKSKEPDITVALFKAAKESVVTIYEPNLQRVEVEDKKGLEVILLLAAEAIRDLYLIPRHDAFNILGVAPHAATNGAARKNSRPTVPSPVAAPMSGALGITTPGSGAIHSLSGTALSAVGNANGSGSGGGGGRRTADIDAETRRLQAMVEREEREREKRDREEQKRIKKMLEDEEKERRRREAEVAKETERLRRKYGVDGQNLPSTGRGSGHGAFSSPPLPPRPFAPPQQPPLPPGGYASPWSGAAPPPRPVSVGPVPAPGPFNNSTLNSWWRGPSASTSPPPAPPPRPSPQGRRHEGSSGGGGPYLHNPAASVSTFFGLNRSDDPRKKVQKKRSVHW